MGPTSPRWLTWLVFIPPRTSRIRKDHDRYRVIRDPYLDTVGLDGNEATPIG